MKKRMICLAMAAMMAAAMTACSSSDTKESTAAPAAPAEAKNYKVGIIQFVDDASLNQIEENIEKELDAKAAELGVTFNYKDYTYNGQADATTLNQIAAELIGNEVDIIVPIATPTAQIVQAATEENKIPVVFSAVSDPVGAKLVASMDAPGANITGTSDALNTDAIMNLIFAVDPDADYIGLLYSKSEDASTAAIASAKAFLDAKGVKYIEKTGTNTNEVSSAADALIAEGVDAVFTPTDNTIMTAELAIYEKFINAKIPHYAGADSFALNGAFCGYGVDYSYLGLATADMVVDILVNGKEPASLAAQTFDNGIASVNTETCEALGLNLDEVKAAFADYCTQIVELKTQENF